MISHEVAFYDSTTYQPIGLPWRNPSGFDPVDLLWLDNQHIMIANGKFVTSSGGKEHWDYKGEDVLKPFAYTFDQQLCAILGDGITADEWKQADSWGIALPDLC